MNNVFIVTTCTVSSYKTLNVRKLPVENTYRRLKAKIMNFEMQSFYSHFSCNYKYLPRLYLFFI